MARLDLANARLGARRARLPGAATLRALLPRAAAGEGGDEQALRAAQEREAGTILGWVEGTRARRLLQAWLALDEAPAVKAVLRGVAAGEAVDRILAAAPPAHGLDPEVLRRAAAAGTVEGAALALAAAPSPVGAAASAALACADGGLAAAELAADAAAILRARAVCRGWDEDGRVLAGALADLADTRNAATVLVLAGKVPASPPWIPGGRRLDAGRLDGLARAGVEVARAAIAATFALPAPALATAAGAERALEAARVRALRREARARPLSLAVPLAYLAARREEVRKVALILRGAAAGVEADELLDLVEA